MKDKAKQVLADNPSVAELVAGRSAAAPAFTPSWSPSKSSYRLGSADDSMGVNGVRGEGGGPANSMAKSDELYNLAMKSYKARR